MRVDDIGTLRRIIAEFKANGRTISFVPTMGALHDGHKSCIETARKQGDVLVVSIYVNPQQFAPNEDYGKYPRMLDDDLAFCRRLGCDVVFSPDDDEMYPSAQNAWVTVERLTTPLCGRNRPDHFRGVATVVAKLFHLVDPDVAVFGQKDAQQAVVIREMVRQLNLPVSIVLSPTIRETDGLAVSSRNRYLSADHRKRAAAIYRSLCAGKQLLEEGERNTNLITGVVRDHLFAAAIHEIEYIELLKATDLSLMNRVQGKVILAVAIKLGATRLIDNLVLDVGDDGLVEEGMLFC